MNTTRSDQIKAGLQKSFQSGKSPKASIVCYGYKTSSKGKLQIYPPEAIHVVYTFERFAAGIIAAVSFELCGLNTNNFHDVSCPAFFMATEGRLPYYKFRQPDTGCPTVHLQYKTCSLQKAGKSGKKKDCNFSSSNVKYGSSFAGAWNGGISMRYLLMWLAAISIGLLLFQEYFWINIIVLILLHIVNHKRCGEFTKYALTTFLPLAVAQVMGAALGERFSRAYGSWVAPLLERSGFSVPEGMDAQVPFITTVLLFLVLETFSMRWTNVPIRRNRSAFMRSILQDNSFQIFSSQLSNMLRNLEEETQWDSRNFIRLNAEVDVLCDNKVRPRTKDLLSALQQSPGKNNITLVIGEPGSGKSVAMRELCVELLKKCPRTRRIPLYVNLKHWNKNWENGLYPSPQDLKNFILDSFEQYDVNQFLRENFKEIMNNRGWFFILDSYDEIPFLADKNQVYSSQVSKVIYDFLSSSGGVVSSRPFRSPDAAPERVGNHFRILPFNEGQLIRFFRRDVGLTKAACRTLFAERPDIVDLARTPLLASLVQQYYQEKRAWPINQKKLYQELMTARIQRVLKESGEQGGLTPELMMKMTASLAYRMMEIESIHGFLTLEEARAFLPYPSRQVDAVAGLLEAAKICKLNGTNQNMITFVHRRFMEFFVTQSSQFSRQTVQEHLSDIWTMGSYYDVLALYGEVCEPDSADALAKVCCQVIMESGGGFQNIRDEGCLHAINSLNFLFNAFRNRRGAVLPYITPISEKILEALKKGCHDNACLAVFATVVPILSRRCQEDILIALLNFNYKWISRYLGRIFYQGGKNSEALLLAYIENLNSYRDLSFLRELPVFLFMFAKEKPLRQYCFLRVADILLAAAAILLLGGYLVWGLFYGPLTFTLREPMTWVTWFRSLPLPNQIVNTAVTVIVLAVGIWLADTAPILHIALAELMLFEITMLPGFTLPIYMVYVGLAVLVLNGRLSTIVTLRLVLRKAERKWRAVCGLLLGIGAFALWLAFLCISGYWLGEKPYLGAGVSILWCLFWVLLFSNPIRFIQDTVHLRAALRALSKCGGTLPRPRLEQMLSGICGKRGRGKLIVRLSRMNIQLTGEWTYATRPVVGREYEDQLLTSLDTRDLSMPR